MVIVITFVVGFAMFTHGFWKLDSDSHLPFLMILASAFLLGVSLVAVEDYSNSKFNKACVDNGGKVVILQGNKYGCLQEEG